MAANTNVAFGFRVAFPYGMSPPNFAINRRQVAYNNSNKIAYGDPVKSLSTGYADVMAISGSTIHGIAAGVAYADPNQVGGVYFGNAWNATSGLASTTNVELKVYNDPTTVFMAQYIGTALTVDNIGNNVDITTATSGAPNSAGISVCSLGGTADTTSTKPFRIIGILGLGAYAGYPSPLPSYVPTNDNQFLFVKMNTSDLLNTTGI